MTTHDYNPPLGFLNRHRIENLLGTPLPRGAADLHYLRWRPSIDLAYEEALIRFTVPAHDYLSFVQACGLTPFALSGPTVHLPIDWAPPPEVAAPPWWEPTGETPHDAAGGPLGRYGSIAVKWERGRVYCRLIDPGPRAAGPDPDP